MTVPIVSFSTTRGAEDAEAFDEYIEMAVRLSRETEYLSYVEKLVHELDARPAVPIAILAPQGTGKTQLAFQLGRVLEGRNRKLLYYPWTDGEQAVYAVSRVPRVPLDFV
jgi:predicted AAA+ superfamily ATPase